MLGTLPSQYPLGLPREAEGKGSSLALSPCHRSLWPFPPFHPLSLETKEVLLAFHSFLGPI